MTQAFKLRHWVVTLALIGCVVLAIVGLVRTRASAPAASSSQAKRRRIVDESRMQTARTLAALATGRDERRYASQALKLADHEADTAFASALRDASEHPPQPTPETQALLKRLNKAQDQVNTGQQTLEKLEKDQASATGARLGNLQTQLDLTRAQLELDADELEDTKEDLQRSGADPLSRIQRQFKRYQAAQQSDANHSPLPSIEAEDTAEARDFVTHLNAWRAVQGKIKQLQNAASAAADAGTQLKQQHDTLDDQVQQEKGAQEAAAQLAKAQLQSKASAPGSAADTISALHRLAGDQRKLAELDKRIQDLGELADAYGNWAGVIAVRERAAIHGMLLSALWTALIVLVVYLACRIIDRSLPDSQPGHTRLRTLRVILRFTVQAIGAIFVLLVVLGTPPQLATILGLAGAGLTVALKDFIVGFIGWFVLMGRNGISVGDWVEIDGVVGEVAEVGVLRTVLLETGNWTDAGHPTGRKVAFVNSFAIEGHFFNFSTSGQWLWDEISLTVPASEDPYSLIEAVTQMVDKETSEGGQQAEQEWSRMSSRYRSRPGSARPAVNLRPTGSGVEVHVRYITRAQDRFEVRSKLYQDLVGLLHQKDAHHATAEK